MKIKPMGITGLHLGLDTLTIARVNGGSLRQHGRAPMPPSSADDSALSLTGLDQAIRQAAQSAGLRGGPCAIAISHPELVVRTLELPDMTADALAMNVSHEMAQFLSLPPERYVISHKRLGGARSELGQPLRLLAVAAQRDWMESVAAAARNAGFTVKAIDCVENAREKLLARLPDAGQSRIAVLDIGRSLSQITVYHRGRYQINRYLYTGLQLPAEGRSVWSPGNSRPEAAAARAEADRLSAEVSSVLDYDYYSGGRVRLSQVYLCGDTALVPGLDEYLSAALELPVGPLFRDDQALTLAGDALAATLREVSR